MVVQLIEWEVILLLEILKYLTGYLISQFESSFKLKRSWGIIGGILLLVPLIIRTFTDWDWLNVNMFFIVSAVVAIICIMDIPIKKRLWQAFILFLCITSLDSVAGNIVSTFSLPENASDELKTVFSSIIILTFLLIIYIFKNLLKKYFPDKRGFIGILFTQIAIIFSGVCQCLNATIIVSELSDNKRYFVIGLFSYMGVAFLGSQIWMILNTNSRMKDLIKEERILHSTQKEYYTSLLDREDETRKYRHDMTNHLMVMNALLNDNSIDELKEYLGNLRDEFGTIQTKRYVTGNAVIDAISSYYLPSVDSFVDIKVRGLIPSDIKTDEVSICTIYSNLVKNAVEELQRLKDNGIDNLKLLIDFKVGEKFLSISVKNTMRDNAAFHGIDTPTSKGDSRNHGIGLGNIKRTVEKECGRIKIEKKDQMFLADVILPIG